MMPMNLSNIAILNIKPIQDRLGGEVSLPDFPLKLTNFKFHN